MLCVCVSVIGLWRLCCSTALTVSLHRCPHQPGFHFFCASLFFCFFSHTFGGSFSCYLRSSASFSFVSVLAFSCCTSRYLGALYRPKALENPPRFNTSPAEEGQSSRKHHFPMKQLSVFHLVQLPSTKMWLSIYSQSDFVVGRCVLLLL